MDNYSVSLTIEQVRENCVCVCVLKLYFMLFRVHHVGGMLNVWLMKTFVKYTRVDQLF